MNHFFPNFLKNSSGSSFRSSLILREFGISTSIFSCNSMAKDKGVASGVTTAAATDVGVDLEFDPCDILLRDDEHLAEYLAYYNGKVGDGITIALAPRKVDYTKAPGGDGGVYIAAQVLALGARLPLPSFAREVLAYYRLAPTQISPGSWRVILSFPILGQRQNVVLGVEEFRAIYFLKPLKGGSYCFSPRKDRGKLIQSVPESDSGWKQSIVLVTGPWESVDPEECGLIPRSWGQPGMSSVCP
jgi:hypothetical protein